MTNPTTESERPEWGACPPGELQGLGGRLRRRASARAAARVASGLVGGAVAVAALAVAWPWAFSPGGISCAACVEQFPAYHALLTGAPLNGAVDGQPPAEPDATLEMVRKHLADCDSCRQAFETRFPGALEAEAALAGLAAVWLLACCRPPKPSP